MDTTPPANQITPTNQPGNQATVSSPPSQPASVVPGTMAPQPRPKKTGLLLAVVLLVILAAVGGFFAYKHFHKTAKSYNTVAAVHNPITDLRYGTTQASMNKFYPKMAGEAIEFDYNAQIYEGLVQFTNNYSTFKPLLAQSWSNPDNSTWVFKLKPNVKFQNGKAFTSADVKHSYEVSINSYVGPYITPTIASVTPNDALTVTIKTKGPDPLLLNKLIYMFIVDDSVSPAVGTGAFMPDPKHPATAEKSTLLAFDDYHQGKPSTRQITYQYYKNDAAIIKAFADNKVDVAGDVLVNGNGTLPATVDKTGRSIFVFNAFLGFNTKDPKSPLSKLTVRKAIYESIDADAYLKARNAVGTPSGQLIPKGVPGYNPSITRPARNVADAKKLLADAGYAKGFTLTFSHLDQVPAAAVDVIKKNLAEIGITVKPESYSDTSIYFGKEGAGELSFYADGLQTVFFDASDILTSALVPANYSNPALDKLLTQAASEFEPSKRLEILKTISQKIVDNVLILPLYDREEIDLKRHNIQLDTGTLISGLGAYLWNAYSDQ